MERKYWILQPSDKQGSLDAVADFLDREITEKEVDDCKFMGVCIRNIPTDRLEKLIVWLGKKIGEPCE